MPESPPPRPTGEPGLRRRIELGPAIALALVSAALSAVLFLLVLLLVSGWSLSPLEAALVVAIVPVSALVGTRIPGDPRLRAITGCALVGAGVLALAFLPSASAAWTVLPQALAGLGMGLALTSLVGPLLPEETPAQTASLLAIRHGGITLALVLLAPITAAELDDSVIDTRERGAALVLDARLPPLDKVELANVVTADLDPADPRETLRRSLDKGAASVGDDPEEAPPTPIWHAGRTRRWSAGINGALAPAFLITGALALLGGLVVLPGSGARATRVSLVVAGAALALSGAQALAATAASPTWWRSPIPARNATCPRREESTASSRTSRWWGSTAQRASSALRGRSSRLRWSTRTPPRATRKSTESIHARLGTLPAAYWGFELGDGDVQVSSDTD